MQIQDSLLNVITLKVYKWPTIKPAFFSLNFDS